MTKVRHVLGISGGKDSAALALYMNDKYPGMDIEYYTCDTGKELDETYELIDKLNKKLSRNIVQLKAADTSFAPFDYYLNLYRGFLPSSNSRWCTKKLKLEPFEQFVGDDPVISYVGIRGDEDRDGYISKKSNIQSIFPFRKNIWSEDVIVKFFSNIDTIAEYYHSLPKNEVSERFGNLLFEPISYSFSRDSKLNLLLDADIKTFNKLVFAYIKTTDYPLAKVDNFPLVDNDEVLVRDDIFNILRESGVGVPAYYEKIDFKINGEVGQYARSRSGCYFCFFQQKIEWIWLYEQHPERFKEAMEYEKEGYSWNQKETLAELTQPDRIKQIKEEYLKRTNRNKQKNTSQYLVDILDDAETEGCAACFI